MEDLERMTPEELSRFIDEAREFRRERANEIEKLTARIHRAEELERAKGQLPEQRRGKLRLIQGGAAAALALVLGWAKKHPRHVAVAGAALVVASGIALVFTAPGPRDDSTWGPPKALGHLPGPAPPDDPTRTPQATSRPVPPSAVTGTPEPSVTFTLTPDDELPAAPSSDPEGLGGAPEADPPPDQEDQTPGDNEDGDEPPVPSPPPTAPPTVTPTPTDPPSSPSPTITATSSPTPSPTPTVTLPPEPSLTPTPTDPDLPPECLIYVDIPELLELCLLGET